MPGSIQIVISRNRDALLTAIIVSLILSAAWLAYRPALSGAFLLDDLANLGDLQHVDDVGSALQFVSSGSAGPLGRPLALASFVVQADEWEQGAGAYLAVNIAIHLLNACLLGSFLYLLTRARGASAAESRYVSLVAMSLWLFMPLLASSTLMVVQRMTTLSATFILLGLNGYVHARASIEQKPGRALWGMSTALVLATLLAVLTKESGALLPLLVLAVEATVLLPPERLHGRTWRIWVTLFLGLPACLIFAYLIYRFPYDSAMVLKREFTAVERLMTEARILWEYVINAFVPRPGQYGPYHDAYPVAGMGPLTLLAALGWVMLVAGAIWKRRAYPVLALAVLWFVGGHLLESTTIPLELYFEHRNYVPMMGPAYALSCLVLAGPDRYRKIARAALPLYIVVSALFLYSLSSLWGQPAVAAAYWHERYPDSVRAATAAATYQLAGEGPQVTLRTLSRFAANHPDYAFIRIPALTLSCLLAPSEDHREEAGALAKLLEDSRFSYTAGTMLSDLLTMVHRQPCNGVDSATVEQLAQSLALNPRYLADERYRHFQHRLMATINRDDGDFEVALDHLEEAVLIEQTPELNMMMVTLLAADGHFDAARDFIRESEDKPPLNPLKRIVWSGQLDELKRYVDHLQHSSTQDGSTEARTEAR